jgi:hypothetical protein
MAKFFWVNRNAIIEAELIEKIDSIVKLYQGEINYNDGSVSKFDFLILPSNELKAVEEKPKNIGGERPPTRRRSPR